MEALSTRTGGTSTARWSKRSAAPSCCANNSQRAVEGLRELLDRIDHLQAWCETQNSERSYDVDNVLAERLYRLEVTDEPPENYPAE